MLDKCRYKRYFEYPVSNQKTKKIKLDNGIWGNVIYKATEQ